jgi:hypothetical protein
MDISRSTMTQAGRGFEHEGQRLKEEDQAEQRFNSERINQNPRETGRIGEVRVSGGLTDKVPMSMGRGDHEEMRQSHKLDWKAIKNKRFGGGDLEERQRGPNEATRADQSAQRQESISSTKMLIRDMDPQYSRLLSQIEHLKSGQLYKNSHGIRPTSGAVLGGALAQRGLGRGEEAFSREAGGREMPNTPQQFAGK